MSEELTFSVLSLDRAGYSADQMNLNRPSEDDEPDGVSLAVLKTAARVDVFVFRGMCPTGGYAIDVQEVSLCESEVCITVELIDPAPGDVVTMMMTRPVKVVRFPGDTFPARYVSVRDPDGCVHDREKINL